MLSRRKSPAIRAGKRPLTRLHEAALEVLKFANQSQASRPASYAIGRLDKSNSLDLRSRASSCPGRDGSMNVMDS